MIDHFNLPVSNLEKSRAFYEVILTELGYSKVGEDIDAIGFGRESWAFGIVQSDIPIPRIHVAFIAKSKKEVQAFFRTAMDSGARSNGPPGTPALNTVLPTIPPLYLTLIGIMWKPFFVVMRSIQIDHRLLVD